MGLVEINYLFVTVSSELIKNMVVRRKELWEQLWDQ